MKNIKRIVAFVLTIVMLMSSLAFAADPTVSIVSPTANSISTSDSLLISVKLNKPGTIKITIYEEMEKLVETKTSESAVSAAAISSAAVKKEEKEAKLTGEAIVALTTENAVTGPAITNAAITSKAIELTTEAAVSYKAIDTTSFEAIDFVSNPALDTYVDRIYLDPVTYTSTEKIGFYTKQLTGVKPGLYKIKVQVLDKKGNVTETVSSLIAIKAKPVVEEKVVFEQKQTGAIKVLQNLLKSLFK